MNSSKGSPATNISILDGACKLYTCLRLVEFELLEIMKGVESDVRYRLHHSSSSSSESVEGLHYLVKGKNISALNSTNANESTIEFLTPQDAIICIGEQSFHLSFAGAVNGVSYVYRRTVYNTTTKMLT